MRETPIARITNLCCKIDEIACDVYAKLADLSAEPDLSKFWRDMSKEEAKHISFWRRTEQIKEFLGKNVKADFNSLIQKADNALYQAKKLGRDRVVEYLMDDLKPQQSLSDKSKIHP